MANLKNLPDQLKQFAPDEATLRRTLTEAFQPRLREAKANGQRLIDYAAHRLEAPDDFEHFHTLLADLEKARKEPYKFTVYAANKAQRSINFGLITTYQQRWEPVSYQVGRLVRTAALAPKEVRRFTKRSSTRTTRAEKETTSNVRSSRSESSEGERFESEIIAKALAKTNFALSAQGGVNVGIANASASAASGGDTAKESQQAKKSFHEAVTKAAEELKAEHAVEVNFGESAEYSSEESGEISNPNDELPVTYLFYELQRRYKVSEQIKRLRPVVLVAQEFPKPDEIDDDWLVAHDWILRRVLLDDSFRGALEALSTRVVGDEFALREQYQNLQQHRRLVEDLKQDTISVKTQVGRRYEALQRSIANRADDLDREEGESFFNSLGDSLFGSDDPSPEGLRVREEASRDAYERAATEEREMLARLDRETSTLESLTQTYVTALSAHLNRKTQIARLRVHVKQNIVYYMQAIWSHEPPDQRFFRLHDVRVPRLNGKLTYKVEADPTALPQPPTWEKPHKLTAKCVLGSKLEFATLEELADLDNLLGFKGNYMMFPLRDSNTLTDFMMTPYLDAEAGLTDPDPRGNWTLDDLVHHICCLKHHLTAEEFEKIRPNLLEAYRDLASDPSANGEIVVTPTDSLYIEALPGSHTILEDFKLIHRAVDVKRAQAAVRGAELENLRYAERLLLGETEDPNIEKVVSVQAAQPNLDLPIDNP